MTVQTPDPPEEGKPIPYLIAIGAGFLLVAIYLLSKMLSTGLCCGAGVFDPEVSWQARLPFLFIVACPLMFAVIFLYFGIKGRTPIK